MGKLKELVLIFPWDFIFQWDFIFPWDFIFSLHVEILCKNTIQLYKNVKNDVFSEDS